MRFLFLKRDLQQNSTSIGRSKTPKVSILFLNQIIVLLRLLLVSNCSGKKQINEKNFLKKDMASQSDEDSSDNSEVRKKRPTCTSWQETMMYHLTYFVALNPTP